MVVTTDSIWPIGPEEPERTRLHRSLARSRTDFGSIGVMQKKTVGIIGAGISGLATAKAFASQGHAVTVLEKLDTLGGVWSPARRYPGLRIQISRKCYCLSDFPMPDHYQI